MSDTTNQALAAALQLAALGWPVFPVHTPVVNGEVVRCSCGKADCTSVGKHPNTRHGIKDATTDPEQIKRWWRTWPDANIGVAVGKGCGEHGVFVLDVDPRHDGDKSLQSLEAQHGPLPRTIRARTGGGGEHFFFRHPGGNVKNITGLAPGLDIKVDGGYVVVAPSLHASGGSYAWQKGCEPWADGCEFAEAPNWLVDLVQSADTPRVSRPKSNSSLGRLGKLGRSRKGGGSAGSGADSVVIEGARNDTLTSEAGRLRRQGLDEAEIRLLLRDANAQHCRPPLSEDEVDSIARSVAAYPKGAAQPSDKRQGVEYEMTEWGIVWNKPTANGVTQVALSNFTACIVGDIVQDDGVEYRRQLEISARVDGRQTTFSIPVEQFKSMHWPLIHLGCGAVIYPGHGAENRAAAAIQLASKSPERRTEYMHIGWREIDGQNVYLHAGGAITSYSRSGGGEEGAASSATPLLTSNPSLKAFALPEPPAPHSQELIAAVRSVVKMADVAPDRITLPLLAGVFRAALGLPDFSLFIVGRTNTFKSELAALAQRFFGPKMGARNLPGSWTSTGNALEDLAFLTKDALLVIDDFKPSGDPSLDARLHALADRVLRASGNGSGRQRMRADGTLRSVRPPRALIVSTGEELPRGESLRTRMLILELRPGEVNSKSLTHCQKEGNDGQYALVIAAFCQWLAGSLSKVQAELAHRSQLLREQWSGKPGLLGRHFTALAELQAVFEIVLRFVQETTGEEAITAERATAFSERMNRALEMIAIEQAVNSASADPVERYLDLLRDALASGRAHLCDSSGDVPPQPEMFGWQFTPEGQPRPRGNQIGWIDGNDVYLLPDAAYKAANESAPAHQGVAIAEKTLRRRLDERGLLAATDDERQTKTVRRTLQGVRQNVLQLRASTLLPGSGLEAPA